ncbi:hypothetical protein Tco_0088209 [Tanacetum coccineum]
MDEDLFTYAVEIPELANINLKEEDDLEQWMAHGFDDGLEYDPLLNLLNGDDEVELTDEETSDSDDNDKIATIFRIETNVFDFETPSSKALEFNYLLQIDPDVLTKDIKGFKTHDEYKDDWICEWDKDVPWVHEKPWTDVGAWKEPTPVKHYGKPFNYKIGNSLYYQDLKWYEALEDGELKEEALKHKAIVEGIIEEDDESINEGLRRWDGYEITNRDHEEIKFEMEHYNEGRCELFDDHELSVCNIRKIKMIKYSFVDDEKYVAIKKDEYDDLTSTSKDACRAYQEIFCMMDEGWMDLAAKKSTKLVKYRSFGILSEQNLAETSVDDNVKYELSEELLKEISSSTYSGRVKEDVVGHIAKILEILDPIKVDGMDPFQLRMITFPLSLSEKARKLWMNKADGKINTWEELVNKFFSEFYPLSCASNYDKMCVDNEEGLDPLEFITWMNSKFKDHKKVDETTKRALIYSWIEVGNNEGLIDEDISNRSDITKHTGKVLEIIEWIKIPNVDKYELRLHAFSKSLSGDAKKWRENEGTTTTWKELCDKFFHKYYPLSHTYKSKIPDDLGHGTDYFEFLYWLASKFDNYWEFYVNRRTNATINDLINYNEPCEESNEKTCSDLFFKPYLDAQDGKDIYEIIDRDYSPIPIPSCHHISNPDELCQTEEFTIVQYSVGSCEECITVGLSKINTVEKNPGSMSCIYHELFNKKDHG